MWRWLVLPLFAGLVLASAGCRNCNKVERELAAREQDVQTLKEENNRLDCTNHALERELSAVRGLPGPNGLVEKPSEPYPVRSLALGRQTGGRTGDCGGDDGLTVIVEPRDCDNQAIKAPGSLVVELYEKPDEGEVKPLWRWMVPPPALRRSWQNGLFSTGYRLDLDFGVWPTTPKLRVVAKFQMINGRVFVADKDITVRIPPERTRRQLPPPTPVPSMEDRSENRRTLPDPTPAPTPPPEEKPEPKKTLPPPKEEKSDGKAKPKPDNEPAPKPDNDSPGKKSPSDELKGPILTRTKAQKAAAQILAPVPLENDE